MEKHMRQPFSNLLKILDLCNVKDSQISRYQFNAGNGLNLFCSSEGHNKKQHHSISHILKMAKYQVIIDCSFLLINDPSIRTIVSLDWCSTEFKPNKEHLYLAVNITKCGSWCLYSVIMYGYFQKKVHSWGNDFWRNIITSLSADTFIISDTCNSFTHKLASPTSIWLVMKNCTFEMHHVFNPTVSYHHRLVTKSYDG